MGVEFALDANGLVMGANGLKSKCQWVGVGLELVGVMGFLWHITCKSQLF